MNGRTDTHTHTQSANQTVGLGRAREDQEEDNMRPKRSGLGGTNIGASTPGPRYPLYSGVVFCPAKRRKRQVTRLLRPPPFPTAHLMLRTRLLMPYVLSYGDLTWATLIHPPRHG